MFLVPGPTSIEARRCVGFLAMVLAAAGIGASDGGRALAQAPTAAPRAGLVVSFSDGTTRSFCVPLDGGRMTGIDLLERAGLAARVEVSASGTVVCSIDGDGCPAPEPCWCRCASLGGTCSYWSYQVLDAQAGRWTYAQVGAAARVLTAGDVDGWAWGEGTADAGPEPPVLTIEKICTASPSTETTQPANSSEVERAATDARDTAWGVSLPNLFVVVLVVLGLAGAAAWLQRR